MAAPASSESRTSAAVAQRYRARGRLDLTCLRRVSGRAGSDWRRCDRSRFHHAVFVLHDRKEPVPETGRWLHLVQGERQHGGNDLKLAQFAPAFQAGVEMLAQKDAFLFGKRPECGGAEEILELLM